MKKTVLSLATLQAIAAINPEGFTIDKNTMEPITTGFSVAVAETQNSFNEDGAKKVIQYVSEHEEINAVGGWLNSENGYFYYDAVVVVNDLETATQLGKANKQIAIFDINTLTEIML